LRILDISDPENLSEVAFFDTYPGSDAAGYTGSWGVYSFVESGTVLVSNFDEGLFVLDVSASPVAVESVVDARLATLSPVWPNPFRDRTSFTVSLERPGRLRITLHDVRGRTVADIFDGVVASGQEHRFDAEPGQDLPAGLYVLRVLGPGVSASRPVTRIR